MYIIAYYYYDNIVNNVEGKTGTNILNKVPVPVINNNECLEWHRQKNIDLKLYGEMMCAGHQDGLMDACLVSTVVSTHHKVGVNSHSAICWLQPRL